MSIYATNQHLIELRRKQETKYREMDSAIANDRRIMHVAAFEEATTNKINRRLKQVIIPYHLDQNST
jgi:hypothetical protein